MYPAYNRPLEVHWGDSAGFQGEGGLVVSAEAELDLGVLAVTEQTVRQYLEAVGDEQPAYFDLALAPPLALSAWFDSTDHLD